MKSRPKLLLVIALVALEAVLGCRNKTATKTEKPEDEQVVVGRITFLERNVFRYLQEAKDWTLAVLDIPVRGGDVLYSDVQGKTELTFPNDTKVRLNDTTKIQLDALKGNLTSVYLNSGVARVQNRGTDAVVKVETPYGQIVSRQPSSFDVYVNDKSVTITSLKGAVTFIDSKETERNLQPESGSLRADETSVSSSPRVVDQKWDRWNDDRDNDVRRSESSRSQYLPDQLQSDARVLTENGRWEQVSYEGENATYWTPTNVSPDWSPFTVGQWTTWYDEQLWVPYEPFGWVTHHYGGWIFVTGRWYWRPPVMVTGLYVVPWYPARVGWVYTESHIGWVPLCWHESYYGRYYWGPRTVVYKDVYKVKNVDVRRFVNVNKAVVVEKAKFYGSHRRYESIKNQAIVRQVVNSGRNTAGMSHEALRGADLRMEHHIARSGDFSHKPQTGLAQGFVDRQARRQTARNPEVQKTSLKTPDLPAPHGVKPEQQNKRNLPETPQSPGKTKGTGQQPHPGGQGKGPQQATAHGPQGATINSQGSKGSAQGSKQPNIHGPQRPGGQGPQSANNEGSKRGQGPQGTNLQGQGSRGGNLRGSHQQEGQGSQGANVQTSRQPQASGSQRGNVQGSHSGGQKSEQQDRPKKKH